MRSVTRRVLQLVILPLMFIICLIGRFNALRNAQGVATATSSL